MVISLFVLGLTALLSLLFVVLLLSSSRYASFVEPLNDKEFPIKASYGAGFAILALLKIDLKSARANKLRGETNILYGDKYGEYYLRVLYAQKLTLCYLTLIVSCVFSSLAQGSDKLAILAVGFVLTGALYYHFDTQCANKIKKRSHFFLKEFPNAVSAMALLVTSGMMLREAWLQVSQQGDNELYVQMRQVTNDMNNGISEADALYAFSLRCATPEIKRFTSFIVQGLDKASSDLLHSLRAQSEELWEAKKQSALQQGEAAAAKLLIPILIMFIGVLILVMGPVMSNLTI